MSNHPLKMADKLKTKKRPTTKCRIFVGDPEQYRTEVEESFENLLNLLRDFDPEKEMPEPMKIAGKAMMEDLAKIQEPFYQTFVFRALHPVKFEELMDEYPPPEGKKEMICDWPKFNPRIFKECLIEPAYDSLSDDEWQAFFDECSHKEYEVLMNTSMDANIRNVDPQSPKDLMTRHSR